MEGPLTPEQQVKVLAKIWGRDREGFVFLPWISGKARTKQERRKNYHEGQPFAWPADEGKILSHLRNHDKDDVYFAPCLFGDNRRVEQYAEPERALWADLDPVDPEAIDQDYRPTIAWETSPGRYQGVWLLSHPRVGASWAGNENHRLTAYLEADPSGWDTTQLLRVPGRMNHKPDYGSQAVAGRLLWDNGPRYTPDDFDDLPAVSQGVEEADTELLTDVLAGVDRHEVWGRIRLKVNPKIREYMAARNDGGADRSSVLWQIERELADHGCSLAEIVAVVKDTIWNKYAGRNDELKRLQAEAAKALKVRAEESADGDGALEIVGADKPELRWLTDVLSTRLPRPKWLIRDVWSRGGCGFISGDPKSYKSWFGLDMAVSIATGTPFLGEYPVMGGPQPVGYFQEEDGEIIVRARLEQVLEGKAPDAHWEGQMIVEDGEVWWEPPSMQIPMAFYVRSGFTASDPGWQSWMSDLIQEAGLVLSVIDTLGTTAGEVDTDRAPDLMHKILRPLKYIAEDTGCAMAVIHHNKKGGDANQRGGSRMLGSVALHAWVDDALYVHSREKMAGGSRVRVERESKSSVDARWTVEIPHMTTHDRSGNRTVWEPVTGMWAETADPDAPEAKSSSTPNRRVVRDRNGRPAGWEITRKVRLMNYGTRPVPTDRLVAAHGLREADALKQLEKAVANGLLTGDKDSGWLVVLTD